jgi:predicted RNase H-like nuclease (RuvC/YqgF family)
MLLLVALGTNLAQAGSIYKWLDDTGQLHYSHTVPPEVVRMEYQRLNSQAVVMEHIESADVPNMLAEIEQTQDQKSRRITKRLLLATYHSVDDIANERDQALSYLNKEQQINDRYLKLLNDRLREARYMYQHLSDNQGLAYSTMQATIDSLTASIRQQQQQLATLDNKRNLVQRQYQIEVSRYNEALMLSETNQLELRMPAMDYKNQ